MTNENLEAKSKSRMSKSICLGLTLTIAMFFAGCGEANHPERNEDENVAASSGGHVYYYPYYHGTGGYNESSSNSGINSGVQRSYSGSGQRTSSSPSSASSVRGGFGASAASHSSAS